MMHDIVLRDQVIAAMREYADDLEQMKAYFPGITSIVERIVILRISWDVRITYDINDIRMSLVYVMHYALPILECMGLLQEDTIEDAVYWGIIQLSFGLYLRYIDYTIDADTIDQSAINQTFYAHAYLNNAIEKLAQRGHGWTALQRELFMYHLDYERRLISHAHNMIKTDVWHRVSPLCIVLTTWMNYHNISCDDCMSWYKIFLTCALLSSDCDDAIEDFYHKRRTLITEQIQRSIIGNYLSATEIQKLIVLLRSDIAHDYAKLVYAVQQKYPVWHVIVKKFIVAQETEQLFYVRRR
jgi:hypothetical protein